jgi:hypothetical protein
MSEDNEAPRAQTVMVDVDVEAVASAHLKAGGGILRAAPAAADPGFGDAHEAPAAAPVAPAEVPAAQAEVPAAEPAPAGEASAEAAPAPTAAPASPLHQVARPRPRDPAWFRPVFVLAPARSNSSVVSSMIGMHPDLYGFPELSLFRGSVVRDLITDRAGARGLPQRARTAGLARTIAELHEGRQDEDTVTRARRWLAEREDWEVPEVLDHLLGRVAPRVGIEKSPEDSNRQDYLERLDAAYPRARYLHVTRHPVPTVHSMYKAWFDQHLWDIPDDRFHLHLLGTWMFHHGRVKRFTAALPPDRWMRVRSEDVLNDPETTLPAICRWLGIDPGPEAVEAMMHPERSPFAKLGPSNALGGNDPKFLGAPVPKRAELPATLDLPEEWVVDPWLHVGLVEFAAGIGYPHEPAG